MKAWLKLYYYTFLILLNFSQIMHTQNILNSPIDISKRVADKIIRETSFDFQLSQQKPSETIQVIDFGFEFPAQKSGVAYAISYINSKSEGDVKLAISHDSPIKIWINDEVVFTSSDNTIMYEEIAYDLYSFPVDLKIKLNSGENKILVKSLLGEQTNSANIALLDSNNFISNKFSFSLSQLNMNFETNFQWALIGPFKSDGSNQANTVDLAFAPEYDIKNYYENSGQFVTWQLPNSRLILKDVINNDYSFQKHSYFEWHYSNGQTMLALKYLADISEDPKYLEHVIKYCTTTLNTYNYFKYQYNSMHEKTGFNYRIFRKAMLDDSSAPVLPFIELYNLGEIPEAKFIIDIMADYISNNQSRLADGTLCRPEPELETIWADDLFMGVPFLLRYAKMTNNNKYYEDASKQAINFFKYLFDEKHGILFHAWFDQKKQNSEVHWGRANGWIAWAVSEALIYLPESNQNYNEIMTNYLKLMEGLTSYQGKSGLWHQILDDSKSFEETSCSAMFVLALARGIRYGWLPDKYKDNVFRGWEAIKTKIDTDGTVNSICQGTGIGENVEFYLRRETPPHDPRGLGAVIMAGIEVQQLTEQGY